MKIFELKNHYTDVPSLFKSEEIIAIIEEIKNNSITEYAVCTLTKNSYVFENNFTELKQIQINELQSPEVILNFKKLYEELKINYEEILNRYAECLVKIEELEKLNADLQSKKITISEIVEFVQNAKGFKLEINSRD